jgi:hypothetical protein
MMLSLNRKLMVFLAICGILTIVLAVNSCNPKGCTMTEKTVVIQPVHLLSMYDTQDNLPWFCTSNAGTGPDTVAPTEVIVGYFHEYFSGWPCSESINQIYQGAVWFPVVETIGKKLVKSATLNFSISHASISANAGGPSCATSLCRDDEDSWWNRGRKGLTSYSECITPIPPARGGNFSIDVSTAVQDWVYGRATNNGFVLVGPLTSFDQFSDDGMLTLQQCETWYSNFTLTVTFYETN